MKNITQLNEVRKGCTGYGLLVEHDGHISTTRDQIGEIYENIRNNSNFIVPEKMIVSAVFQKYGVENANGRIYPKEVLVPEVDRYIRERVANRCAIGSLDHPASSQLSGHDVSHLITNLDWEGKTLIGEMEIHITPGYQKYGVCSTSGDLVANMLLSNILIGVSSRAVGNVEERLGKLIVTDGLELIGWDVVVDNSTPGAKIANSREELKQYVESKDRSEGEIINEKIDRICGILL